MLDFNFKKGWFNILLPSTLFIDILATITFLLKGVIAETLKIFNSFWLLIFKTLEDIIDLLFLTIILFLGIDTPYVFKKFFLALLILEKLLDIKDCGTSTASTDTEIFFDFNLKSNIKLVDLFILFFKLLNIYKPPVVPPIFGLFSFCIEKNTKTFIVLPSKTPVPSLPGGAAKSKSGFKNNSISAPEAP